MTNICLLVLKKKKLITRIKKNLSILVFNLFLFSDNARCFLDLIFPMQISVENEESFDNGPFFLTWTNYNNPIIYVSVIMLA